MSGVGHNSGGIAGERLQSFIERIERLAEEKDALTGDIREVFSEAKGNGFDVAIMRQLIRPDSDSVGEASESQKHLSRQQYSEAQPKKGGEHVD